MSMAWLGPGPGSPETRDPGFTYWQLIAAAGVGGAALLVYLCTMYPDIAGGDSGEIVAAVASGGVIHPPGYPLYSLLAKLFVHLPLRTLAWRLGLMSALCDAAAAAVLCLGVARWSRSIWTGIAAAGLFALSPGIWEYAICAEVFALNNLMVASLLLLAVLYADSKNPRCAIAAALLFGLGLSNHHTFIFVAVPFAAWAFVVAGVASIGMPGFSGFWAEIQVLVGAWMVNPWWVAVAGVGIIVGVAYTCPPHTCWSKSKGIRWPPSPGLKSPESFYWLEPVSQ